MAVRRTLRSWFRRFRAAEGGVAAVEFAMVLPIMLLLYIGMVETTTLISLDRKIQTVSGAVGDLVARSNGVISPGAMDNYVKVAAGIMTPYASNDLVQTVTQVYVDGTGKPTVEWSRRYSGETLQNTGAHVKGAIYPLPDKVVAIATGEYVIVTETTLTYPPLFGLVSSLPVNLYRENFFMPRFREKIDLK